jgi:hypothetical protein
VFFDATPENECPWPFRVFRIGFGNYEGSVRVARLDEDTSIFEVGEWVEASRCLKLEISDFLDVRYSGLREAFDDRPCELAPGTRCQFLGFDVDGDVLLRIGSRRTAIFFRDLLLLTLV